MTAESLSSLDRSTLRERALESLQAAIISGQYRPGDHLGEVDLASHLGVSRGTVREALRHLQQEGLVSTGTRGRLRVSSLSPREIRELFSVRAALEGFAVTQIVLSPRRAEIARELRDVLSRMDKEGGGFASRVAADLAFHLQICELSGNSMLVESWRHLVGRIQVAIINVEPSRAPVMMSQSRHSPLVQAIEDGRADVAVSVVQQHMASAAEHFAGDRGTDPANTNQ